MAKKRSYPESKSMTARLEVMIEANILAASTLDNLIQFGLSSCPDSVRTMLAGQAQDALESLDKAMKAMNGDDD